MKYFIYFDLYNRKNLYLKLIHKYIEIIYAYNA